MTEFESAEAGTTAISALRNDMLRFAVLQLRDQNLAEDVVHDAMVAALEAQRSFSGQSSLKTWVFGILRHKIIDLLRCRGREICFSDLVAEGQDMDESIGELFSASERWTGVARPSHWDNPEESLEQCQFWAIFYACLDHLAENTARIFMMRVFLDLDIEEICVQMGMTPNNCYVVLYRARMKLRICLDREWFTREEQKC